MTELREHIVKSLADDAKFVVDVLFDKKMFRDNITRDQLNEIEGYINAEMSSCVDRELRRERRDREFRAFLASENATHFVIE